ncbi:MAG TPA: DNA ligase D [Solirubrobacteraceae bacterium]|jgi:bifunctional non-homologous end joining protein LigD|nr:DNA ligase D [Solirubrobacteraceae bacterium]
MAAEERTGKLGEYRARRDFRRTPEPAGRSSRGKSARVGSPEPSVGGARFVVHEHHARRLHWDLRLERDGALMSWAVPNGIPQDPKENRKAIHVEDHPLSYLDFEGEIPEGNYGAGRILVWDQGHYDCEKLEDGKLVVVFHGRRLRGRYALFRAGEERDWMIHRMDPPEREREAMPEHLAPMLASAGELPRARDGWAFEIKWDGVRAIAYWRPGRLRLESRNRKDITVRYPELRALGRQLGAREAVLDGEVVALDAQGRPSFERLQRRMHVSSESVIRRLADETPVTYAIFDLLYLDGRQTLRLPYRERRELLEGLKLDGPAWRTPACHAGDGRDLLNVSAEHGLEGVLAKRLDAPYRPGERSGDWLKVKNVNRQEFVIGGWLDGKGRRAGSLGALLVGYHEGERDGRALRYAGRVGTGFDERELERLAGELARRGRHSSPFAPRGTQPPRGAHFVEPELVAEIEFSHLTRDRILRHSSYKGLRPDKPAAEVELESSPAQSTARRGKGPQGRPARQVLPETERAAAGQPYRVLHETKRHTEIEVDGRTLRLSNREKVLYPRAGFTKGQMVDHYAAIAPVLLGHLAGRPLTLKRYPDGVDGEHFYEKRCPAHRPGWVKTAAVWSESLKEAIDYCLVEDLPTLIWAANLAGIELHPSLHRARDVDVPTSLVFDLDPGAPAGLRACCQVALLIRELFETFAIQTLVKTSGAKGLQVYVPLNTPVTYAQTKPFARAVAELLEKQHPKLALSRMSKSLRPGKVLVDWSQNDPHKTTVCVYSLRARERPTISTPLTWEEVERASRRRREPELSVEPEASLERIERHGDLFAPLLTLTQVLPDPVGQAAGGPR